jgi:hypothetical protein
MSKFFGREKELAQLNRLLKKDSASLVVIKGRRRIGKSRLAEEFAKPYTTYRITGLPPEPKVTSKVQREHFAAKVQKYFAIPGLQSLTDWSELLWHLAQQTKRGRVIIILDEINWIGSKDPTFLGKLKTAWDESFKSNPKLIMILSGSMSAWIEKNILSSTAFVGRISLDMTLQELPLHECSLFWGNKKISAFEKFKVLSVTGGIPRYLEEIDPSVSSDENIRRLCFEKEGFLFNEFEKIFTDLFIKDGDVYRTILEKLVSGKSDLASISKTLKTKPGGTVSNLLQTIKITGFIAQDYTWSLQDGTISRFSYFRLKDNYTRFYLKYINPDKEKIEKGVIFTLPGWDAIMGLQFENLVLNNAETVWKQLEVRPENIVFANPFFQKKTASQDGCQIDYLIQTKFNVLYLCEIKFSQHPIKSVVIQEVKEKIARLKVPKRFSVLPVLIQVNGVTEQVAESGFFSHIIDFAEFLTPRTNKL